MGGFGEVRIETTAQLVADQERSPAGGQVRVRLLPCCARAPVPLLEGGRGHAPRLVIDHLLHGLPFRDDAIADARRRRGRDARDLRD